VLTKTNTMARRMHISKTDGHTNRQPFGLPIPRASSKSRIVLLRPAQLHLEIFRSG
jgi:hypothetical protein